ncbi:ribosomal RNA large subunit methyltransferase M-like [Schistocerca gregaria]|uniref:ribosomal RNA large subunit methyltransferase M-like n=1 Tax=Schistocerca gregaria TaxID=7010 RepID=UPI00211EB7B9|nr:ribosomal RNA large subunit methyltransferase M-like [Schistocerca gregaria]
MKSSELPKNGNVLVQLFMTQKTTLAVSVSEVSKNSAFWNYPLPWKYGRVYVPVEKHYPAASYAKCKEILCHMDLNKDDLAGKRVVELGTVPGGWTMVLLEQGAEVNSVDWTDLKDPWFKVHSSLRHHTMDAKIFNPVSIGILDRSEALDYVFCDLALPPVKSVDLMEMWIQNRWAERVIWTFKMGFGHEVSHALTIRGIQKCLAKYEPEFVCTIRHLYKHENEVVVLGRWTDEMRARAESKKSIVKDM